MRRLSALLYLVCATSFAIAQTDENETIVVKRKSAVSTNIGIGFGLSYSNLLLQSEPYLLVDSISIMGNSSVKNSLGINISLFYRIPINERFQLRAGLDAQIMRAMVLYDQRSTNRQRTEIFPVTVEIPIVGSFNLLAGSKREDGSPRSLTVLLGLRPVIPVMQFRSLYPTTIGGNLNVDAGIGIPINTKRLNIQMEAIYSYGLLNLIGKNETDYHTTSVSYLGRSYAGLRFYF